MPGPVNFRGVRVGVPICEDIWGPEPVECLAETGGEILLVPNGSPYWRDDGDVRLNIAVPRVTETGLPLVYVNQVGGQDELVFDGASFALNADRSLAFQLPAFTECVVTTQWRRKDGSWRCESGPIQHVLEGDQARLRRVRAGLARLRQQERLQGRGARPFRRHRFRPVAAIAVDALGPERVRCIMLPYKFTVANVARRCRACAKALGVGYEVVPISEAVEGLEKSLKPLFAGQPRDVTEENLQARARGTILMAVSNKFNLMVVTTGNKSEMSVGYATLYGDMNGGFNPIKDSTRPRCSGCRGCATRGSRPARWGRTVWSSRKTSSPGRRRAELREDQKDQDSLPPYERARRHPRAAGRARGADCGHRRSRVSTARR